MLTATQQRQGNNNITYPRYRHATPSSQGVTLWRNRFEPLLPCDLYYCSKKICVICSSIFFRNASLALGQAWVCTGVGVTKPISSVPLFSKFFLNAKTLVTDWISYSYLTYVVVVTAVKYECDLKILTGSFIKSKMFLMEKLTNRNLVTPPLVVVKQSWRVWVRLTLVTPETVSWFNIKISSYQYRESHCGDKTVVRSSYLHNGISYTGEISSLYWIRPQNILVSCWCTGSISHQGISRHDIDSTVLTHWGQDKWPPFFRRHFQMHFLEWKCINFD